MLFCLPPDLGVILVHLQMFWAVPQLCGLWIKSVWVGAAAGLAHEVIVVIRGCCGGHLSSSPTLHLASVTGNWSSVCLRLLCKGQAR